MQVGSHKGGEGSKQGLLDTIQGLQRALERSRKECEAAVSIAKYMQVPLVHMLTLATTRQFSLPHPVMSSLSELQALLVLTYELIAAHTCNTAETLAHILAVTAYVIDAAALFTETQTFVMPAAAGEEEGAEQEVQCFGRRGTPCSRHQGRGTPVGAALSAVAGFQHGPQETAQALAGRAPPGKSPVCTGAMCPGTYILAKGCQDSHTLTAHPVHVLLIAHWFLMNL